MVLATDSGISGNIIDLGALSYAERPHALQVRALALRLFDELQPMHRMGNTERIWLSVAALWHDVGKAWDPKRHHKVAFRFILNWPELSLRDEARLMVALVARYHRGPLPRAGHRHFGALEGDEQVCVAKLAALLRLADGLDKGRSSGVEDVTCQIRPHSVLLQVSTRDLLAVDKVLRKAELFEGVFGRRIVIHTQVSLYSTGYGLDFGLDSAYAKAV